METDRGEVGEVLIERSQTEPPLSSETGIEAKGLLAVGDINQLMDTDGPVEDACSNPPARNPNKTNCSCSDIDENDREVSTEAISAKNDSDRSMSLGGIRKDDSGFYSEKSPVDGGNSKDGSEDGYADVSESMSECFDDSGAGGGAVIFNLSPDLDRVYVREKAADPAVSKEASPVNSKEGDGPNMVCNNNLCDDKRSQCLGEIGQGDSGHNSDLNLETPSAISVVDPVLSTNHNSHAGDLAAGDSHVSLSAESVNCPKLSKDRDDDDDNEQQEEVVAEDDVTSGADSPAIFPKRVNKSKLHKRHRVVSSSSSDNDDSSFSCDSFSASHEAMLHSSHTNEEEEEEEESEDDDDDDDDDDDETAEFSEGSSPGRERRKKSLDDKEEEEDGVELCGLSAPRHKYRALFDIRDREYGYSRTVPSQFFREKVQGSLQMVQRFRLQCKMEHHEGCVNALHFNNSGTLLASGSDDLNIVLWNWQKEKPALLYDSGHRSNVFQAKFMPFSGDCHVVSCARDGQVRLAELSLTGICKGTKKLAQHKGAAHKLALEYNSPHIFLSCGEDAVTFQVDLRQDKPTRLVTTKENDRKVAMYSIQSNPRNSDEFCVGGRDHFIRIYDKRKIQEDEYDGVLKKFCPQHLIGSDVKANVTCACYNYDGSEVLGTFNDEDIYLFNNQHSDGAEYVHKYVGHRNNQTVKGVNFYGPRSEFVVSGSDCGHIFLWDKDTEKIVQFMHGDEGGVINVLEPHPFIPMLATSGLDHDVKLWAPTAEHPTTLNGLRKVIKRNKRERDEERNSPPDTIDGQMLWFIMHHLRRSRRRRTQEADEGGGGVGGGADVDEDSASDSDNSPMTSEDSEDGEDMPERISCNPS